MKAKVLLLLACSALALSTPSLAAGKTPIEPRATISKDLTGQDEVLDALVQTVRANGYRCDSISVARMMVWSRGFVLMCNSFAYEYEIEDKGGNWRVAVK